MENHHAKKTGKPSISVGHLYHGYVTNNQRVGTGFCCPIPSHALAPRSPGSATPSAAGTATMCTVADGAHVENLRGETGGNSLIGEMMRKWNQKVGI
jgi:hypothetical protein